MGRATRIVFEIEGWPSLQPLCFLSLRFFFEILGLTTGYDLWQMMCLKFLQWGSAPPAVALAKIFGSFFQTLNRKLFFRFLYLKKPLESKPHRFSPDHFFVRFRMTKKEFFIFLWVVGWHFLQFAEVGPLHSPCFPGILTLFFLILLLAPDLFFLIFSLFLFFSILFFLILSYFVSFFLIESHFDLFCPKRQKRFQIRWKTWLRATKTASSLQKFAKMQQNVSQVEEKLG